MIWLHLDYFFIGNLLYFWHHSSFLENFKSFHFKIIPQSKFLFPLGLELQVDYCKLPYSDYPDC